MFDSYPFTSEDVKSSRWIKILEWFKANIPERVEFILKQTESNAAPNLQPYHVFTLVFLSAGYANYGMDAGLVLRGPTIAMVDLMSHFEFGDPTKNLFFDYVREVPSTQVFGLPTPLPVQPNNPVGLETFSGSGVFFSLPGDLNPSGTIVTQPSGNKYKKIIRMTPFGPSSYYLLL